mmetsp:Transcript_34448/g.85908  ORF Transcript_34448/g.85908 Transcript_34448/m.85908 type:complete len:207 (-) Transcript_34448:1856-2476(-)
MRTASAPFSAISKGTLSFFSTRYSNDLRSSASSSTCSRRKPGGKVPTSSGASFWLHVGLEAAIEESIFSEMRGVGGSEPGRLALAVDSATGKLSSRRKVAPCPAPADSRLTLEPACKRRISRTIMSPRPVPPLPCCCPLPTCVKAFPAFSSRKSSAVSPAPVSCTSKISGKIGFDSETGFKLEVLRFLVEGGMLPRRRWLALSSDS